MKQLNSAFCEKKLTAKICKLLKTPSQMLYRVLNTSVMKENDILNVNSAKVADTIWVR